MSRALSAALTLTALVTPFSLVAAAPASASGATTGMELLTLDLAFSSSATEAHALTRAELATQPAALRRHTVLGPIRGQEFTYTVNGKSICLSYAGGHVSVTDGPCAPEDAVRVVDPLLASAQFLGERIRHELREDLGGRDGRVTDPSARFDDSYLETAAARVSALGVQVSGLSDKNWDSLDDDGRVQFRRSGKTICLELPLTPSAKTRIAERACGTLPDRGRAVRVAMQGPGTVFAHLEVFDQVIDQVWDVMPTGKASASRIPQREFDTIRHAVPRGYSVTRVGAKVKLASRKWVTTASFERQNSGHLTTYETVRR